MLRLPGSLTADALMSSRASLDDRCHRIRLQAARVLDCSAVREGTAALAQQMIHSAPYQRPVGSYLQRVEVRQRLPALPGAEQCLCASERHVRPHLEAAVLL